MLFTFSTHVNYGCELIYVYLNDLTEQNLHFKHYTDIIEYHYVLICVWIICDLLHNTT